jgi:hypothetical protein
VVVGINADGAGRGGRRAAKVYRGSRRRVKQLKFRGNGSAELWLFVGWVVFLLLVVLPWMIRQSH